MPFPRLKKIPKFLLRTLLTIAILLLATFVYAYALEPNWIEVKSVPLMLPHLPPAFNGYRIVQISDIHTDRWMSPKRLAHIVTRINQQQPDLVALTGDFVTHDLDQHVPTLAAFQQLIAKDAIVAVMGNHDHWTNVGQVRQALQQAGVVDISNDVRPIARSGQVLQIAGVDDIWYHKDRLDLVLQALQPNVPAILLVHEPDFADISAATDRFDLQISGHSHGGQISIPLFGQPVLPPYGEKYPSGQYQVGSMIQYTNRGVGMVSPRLRFHCRPEITVFNLRAASQSG
jgi:uncharacterized protein